MLIKLRRLQCPNCGAHIEMPPKDGWARCAYCDTVSQLPGFDRTGIGPTNQPAASYPVATYRVTRAGYVMTSVMTVAFAVVGVLASRRNLRRSASGEHAHAAATAGTKLRWASSWSLPCDGRHLLGWAYGPSSTMYLVEVDLETGARVWSRRLDGDASRALLACAGDTAVLFGTRGVAYGFALADGAQRWKAAVGERASSVCDGGAGAVIAALADERWIRITTSDGAMTPIKPQACAPLWSTAPSWPASALLAPGVSPQGDLVDFKPDGMRPGVVFEDPASEHLIAIGSKSPGTEVPMAESYACKKVALAKNFFGRQEYRCSHPHELWKQQIPATDAMEAELPSVEPVASLDAGALYVIYSIAETAHIAALDIATGARRWDHALGDMDVHLVHLIVPVAQGVLVSSPFHTELLDRDTGRRRLAIE